jgi:hypothetical protein
MRVRSFEEFLFENLDIPILRDAEDLVNGIVKSAKKEKRIKKIVNSYYPPIDISIENGKRIYLYTYNSRHFISLSGKDYYVYGDGNNRERITIYVFHDDHSSPVEELEKVFPEELSGSRGDRSMKLNRSKIKTSDFKFYESSSYKHPTTSPLDGFKDMKLVVFHYDIQSETVKFTVEEIMKMPAYKEFMEKTGTVMISSSRELKNGTFSFAFPSEYAVPPKNPQSSTWRYLTQDRNGREKDYLYNSVSIYSSGYVRATAAWDRGVEFRVQVRAKFSPTSEEGWKKGFEEMLKTWEVWRKKWEEEDIILLVTPEKREKKRGLIVGRQFGF